MLIKKPKQLSTLQQSMVQIMGHRLTGNLKKTRKGVTNSEVVDAGAAVVMYFWEFKGGAKFWRFVKRAKKLICWPSARTKACLGRYHLVVTGHMLSHLCTLCSKLNPTSVLQDQFDNYGHIYDEKKTLKKSTNSETHNRNVGETHLKHVLELQFPSLKENIIKEL